MTTLMMIVTRDRNVKVYFHWKQWIYYEKVLSKILRFAIHYFIKLCEKS